MQSSAKVAEARDYLNTIISTQEYCLEASRRELEKLNASQNPSSLEFLSARAFIQAYAGFYDAAINDLSAIVSQPAGQLPRNLNKLAQMLLRQTNADDFDQIVAISNRVLQHQSTTAGDRWMAYHNLALASLMIKDTVAAEKYEISALKEFDDPRSTLVLNLARSAQLGGEDHSTAFTLVEQHMEPPLPVKALPLKSQISFMSASEPMK